MKNIAHTVPEMQGRLYKVDSINKFRPATKEERVIEAAKIFAVAAESEVRNTEKFQIYVDMVLKAVRHLGN